MQNTVELLGTYGSDTTHACSAWTSTSRDLTDEKVARIDKLIDKLMEDKHHTPFEKSALHFLVTTEIATHIHFLKHRIGVSLNGESARYKRLRGRKYYIPGDWDDEDKKALEKHIIESYVKYENAYKRLRSKGFSRKRAKESARFYLPYGIQITADVMFNFRSFLHFQVLRNSEHAQKEVRDLAAEMRRLIEVSAPQFRATLAAFDAMIEKERLQGISFLVMSEFSLIKKGDTIEKVRENVRRLIFSD